MSVVNALSLVFSLNVNPVGQVLVVYQVLHVCWKMVTSVWSPSLLSEDRTTTLLVYVPGLVALAVSVMVLGKGGVTLHCIS